MSGKEILVDTNILLYLLKGNDTLTEMLHGKDIHASLITELELTGFKGITSKEEKQIEALLQECKIVLINSDIRKNTLSLEENII